MTNNLGPLISDTPFPYEEQLEAIIDKASIHFTLCAIAQVCYGKSDHVATNWQDAKLAKQWDKLGEALDELAESVDM